MVKMKKNEYIAFCECGCRQSIVLKADNNDHELSLQLVSDNFYLMQSKGKMSLKEKLKCIWCLNPSK